MLDFARSIGDAVVENIGRAAGRVQEKTPLPADLLESDDAYLVVFDAPDATASDVQVRYVDDRVEVRIDRFRDFYEDFEMRYPGRGLSLDGSVTLPADAVVDAKAATATLKQNGTLQVRVPKAVEEDAENDTEESTETDDTEVSAETADDENTTDNETTPDDES